jgi:hypothetical protein
LPHRSVAQAVFNLASCSIVVYAKVLSDAPATLATLEVGALHFILLYVLVGATQPTSGGHFNPMVSTMMAYWGEIPWSLLPWCDHAHSLSWSIQTRGHCQDVVHEIISAIAHILRRISIAAAVFKRAWGHSA